MNHQPSTMNHQPSTTNHQLRRGDARSSLPRSAPPVAWVGKTPLRPLARPQDRSGSPTKAAPSLSTINHEP
ncbi:MAG: hypothetical protein ACHBN1_13475 [Heteroscytonema crispum UTEX LB 1556]